MVIKNYLLICLLAVVVAGRTQALQKAADDAFLITRMADKYHVCPRSLDNEFSVNVFNTLLKAMDANRIYFTLDDIKQLEAYKFKLAEEVIGRKINFLQLLTSIYTQRLQETDTIVAGILQKPFNYNLPEIYTVQEDTSFAANTQKLQAKLSKDLKSTITKSIALSLKDIRDAKRKKEIIDSVDAVLRKKIAGYVKRNFERKLKGVGGVSQLVGNIYCKSIAACFDPHTVYMTETDRDQFETAIGKKSMVFGFSFNDSKDGFIVINRLQPGSPAFKCGLLSVGDKIVSIQWENSPVIDIINATAIELEDILSKENHAKATITFMKADGTKRQVVLQKELNTENEDEEKVKSYLLKGTKTIGYISLPSFYLDWENMYSINGCSNDVAKEILKLKKENIDGLIIDVRFNGGGSTDEAVDLAGIFIDAGPITQRKTRDPKIYTLKDANRGTIYDGSIILLVNGFSASASELLAGVLQDYNRALIVGSTTYGKATEQRIVPLDTTLNSNSNGFSNTKSTSYLKLTRSQLFRVSGKTAQFTGVIPDIILPDATDAFDNKEKNEPFAIPSKSIEANKYYLPNSPLPIGLLQQRAVEYVKEDPYFAHIKKYIDQRKERKKQQDTNLKLDEFLKTHQTIEEDEDEPDYADSLLQSKFYTINYNSYEEQRIKTDTVFRNATESFKDILAKDAYLRIAYRLLLLMEK